MCISRVPRAIVLERIIEVLITSSTSRCASRSTAPSAQLSLTFNHPVSELDVCRPSPVNERCNNWFNFSSMDNRDPIQEVELFLNNQSRFGRKPGIYFRTVQPHQHHSNIPDSFIYVFSFALHQSVDPQQVATFRAWTTSTSRSLSPKACTASSRRSWCLRAVSTACRFKEGLLDAVAFAN